VQEVPNTDEVSATDASTKRNGTNGLKSRMSIKAPPGGEYVVGAVEAEWVPEGLTEEQFAKLADSYRRALSGTDTTG